MTERAQTEDDALMRAAALVTILLVGAATTVAGGAAAPAAAASTPADARVIFGRMTEAQRIGQLFMVGAAATGVSDATRAAITTYHVGNVILTGRSSLGVTATRSITDGLQGRATTSATEDVPLFVATDQEGGQVQVLSGSGFSSMPSGLTQGTWSTSALQSAAHTWGNQLAGAGVNMNLAPVMDTVPSGTDNPPIGGFDREYGHTPGVVASHGTAFALGMADAGVLATIKHFPGLGRVDANPDTTAGVTDDVTTSNDAYLSPFADAMRAGAPLVMMSTAYYQRIDPAHPAAFSPTIVTGLLRDQFFFHGLVISDDLGNAKQVAAWTPGERAVDFIAAGGDIVLTVNPDLIPAMVSAVASRAATDSTFLAKVDAAAMHVLLMKQARGFIHRPATGDFTGDGRSDVAVYRPSDQTWRILGRGIVAYGAPDDVPVPADYTGSGVTHIAVYRPSTNRWYLRGSSSILYGHPGDIPVPGDYDGDGRDDIAVFRPSTGVWYVRGQPSVDYGQPGDIAVPGDYFGLGYDVPAVFRPATNVWYIRGHASIQWGASGDIRVPGDYTGDGVTDPTMFRPADGGWYVHGADPTQYGMNGDVPVPGFDFDGNGRADIAVWRPSDGIWYIRGQAHHQLGVAGDRIV
jgi:beta-glucosidase-like glycosyl hydrolase